MRKTERKKIEPLGTFGIPPEYSSLPRSLPQRYLGHLRPEAKSILANASAAWKIPSPGQPENVDSYSTSGYTTVVCSRVGGSSHRCRCRYVYVCVCVSVCYKPLSIYRYVFFLKLFLLFQCTRFVGFLAFPFGDVIVSSCRLFYRCRPSARTRSTLTLLYILYVVCEKSEKGCCWLNGNIIYRGPVPTECRRFYVVNVHRKPATYNHAFLWYFN